MITQRFEFPFQIPSLSERFSRFNRYVVGYYCGSVFYKRGLFDNFISAAHRQAELLEKGFDAHIYEIRNEVFLVL